MNLYRYISFEEFMNLLTTKQMHYVNPTKWQDVYEGAMFKALEVPGLRKKLLSTLLTTPSPHGAEIALKNYCKLLFARYHWFGQCWTYEPEESDAFWRIYSYDNHAIRISTTKDQIIDILPSNLYYKESRKVKYDNVSDEIFAKKMLDETLRVKSTYECYFHKRKAFQHEKEYRFLASPKNEGERSILSLQFWALNKNLQFQLDKGDARLSKKDDWISLINEVIELTGVNKKSSPYEEELSIPFFRQVQ